MECQVRTENQRIINIKKPFLLLHLHVDLPGAEMGAMICHTQLLIKVSLSTQNIKLLLPSHSYLLVDSFHPKSQCEDEPDWLVKPLKVKLDMKIQDLSAADMNCVGVYNVRPWLLLMISL